ncbi:hypothetical protein MtrunA17_Chr7g0263791 [Medicago truncatula]|uniref:Protamine P1 family protein n=1 Tax=Medicago truncatula TaxID=3880 RepID=G7L1S0_MEDTR|nr:uncharacterized protein LOC11429895 [Medicago truncatula]AES81811.1 protamine P1 family protein [Medicago truncatula]RHN48439.1 hypothetical protein MtrunA17_Chr7g0263791 [Medicago truncatula]
MKLSTTKSISSPARTDKFPPPLMRFLRTNAGSRSSRRSRSSPMFVLRNKKTIETTQEPSSPKVTCMGQVRAKRSSSKSSTTPTHHWWIKKPNPCRCRLVWPKWAFFRRKKPTKPKQDSVKSESNRNSNFTLEDEQRVSVSVESVDNAIVSNSNCSTPPKNALLLTRCRSAPYRSSSLASRFWSSPLRNEEETESTSIDDNEESSSQSQKRESVSDKEDSIGERIGLTKDLENVQELLLKGRVKKEEEDSAVARPVVLTRCKSEPARVSYRIDPEVNSNLWKKTRLGFPLHILSD